MFISSAVAASALPVLARGNHNVLLLGDEVMLAYKPGLLKLIGDKAECTFVEFPKVGKPDWAAFCSTHIYGKGYEVIHFSYGREIMFHESGKPRAAQNEIWGIYSGLIQALEKSGAFLVGCTTTPVRGKMAGYASGVDWAYGSKFKQQLGPNGVKVNDLGDYTRTRLSEMVQNNSNLPTKVGAQLMAEQVANAVFEAFNEGSDPNRPRILIVGDSIVGGYYGATRNLFAGEAIVYSGGTTYNEAKPDWKKIVDEYMEKGGERGWDIIQFNWGLHAMKHVDEDNKTLDADQPGARVQFPPEKYLQHLELFVKELKRTGAQLVFATTTPIPEDCPGSIVYLDQEAYNAPARKLMKEQGIPVNDLYAFAKPQLKELQIPHNVHVHFTAYGSEQLAKQDYSVLSPLL
ncbi:hypothetical protein P4B35_12545 [Pontiellaceae bacterium B12227]|nr:hypothetical protein [Pontiellaceae bacterium B12227]